MARGADDQATPLKTYDESISVLQASLDRAKVGDNEKMEGLRRLKRFTRTVQELGEPEADLPAVVAYVDWARRQGTGTGICDVLLVTNTRLAVWRDVVVEHRDPRAKRKSGLLQGS